MIDIRLIQARLIRYLAVISVSLLFLSACDRETGAPTTHVPAAFEDGDECHVCGMLITQFPGPKGEVFVEGVPAALKFCSTRDLFAYLLQPEHKSGLREIYVHDMAQTAWAHPEDTALIDARAAWYVAGHELKGAMGPTLAAFAGRSDAQSFIERHGGRLLRFEDINLETITRLGDTHAQGADPEQPTPSHDTGVP